MKGRRDLHVAPTLSPPVPFLRGVQARGSGLRPPGVGVRLGECPGLGGVFGVVLVCVSLPWVMGSCGGYPPPRPEVLGGALKAPPGVRGCPWSSPSGVLGLSWVHPTRLGSGSPPRVLDERLLTPPQLLPPAPFPKHQGLGGSGVPRAGPGGCSASRSRPSATDLPAGRAAPREGTPRPRVWGLHTTAGPPLGLLGGGTTSVPL